MTLNVLLRHSSTLDMVQPKPGFLNGRSRSATLLTLHCLHCRPNLPQVTFFGNFYSNTWLPSHVFVDQSVAVKYICLQVEQSHTS